MARACKKEKKRYSDSDCLSSSDEDTCKKIKKNKVKEEDTSPSPCCLARKLASLSWQQLLGTILSFLTLLVIAAFLFVYGGKIFGVLGGDSIEDALARYHADRLGIADYALESAGGSVLCSSNTYFSRSGALYSIFGIPVWYHSSSPRAVIQPEVYPGKCWAMHGPNGYVTIKLSMPIHVDAVSLEHIPETVSPTGRLDSAPAHFQVLAKKESMNDDDVLLGEFTYNSKGKYVQKFDVVKENHKVFSIATLKILTNHGNPDFTCIYRFRVHGHPPQPDEMMNNGDENGGEKEMEKEKE